MSASRKRILVVEDEEHIRRGLCDVLAYHGHAPIAVASGEEGLDRGLGEPWDLVLLDVMLPGVHGFDVCRRLRQELPRLLILMLTAKGAEDDVVEGLRCGADDYVTKPFSIRELTARIDALLRRGGQFETAKKPFLFGSWEVDPGALRAACGERTAELTAREVELLDRFAREPGRVISRRTLLQELWGMHRVDEIETRTVDVHIAKLRRKIDPELIETVRGAGYRFAP